MFLSKLVGQPEDDGFSESAAQIVRAKLIVRAKQIVRLRTLGLSTLLLVCATVSPCLAAEGALQNLVFNRSSSLGQIPTFPNTSLAIASRLGGPLGDESGAGDCATPWLLALRNASAAGSLPAVTSPPALIDAQKSLAADGRFVLHYTLNRSTSDTVPGADRNRNGVPDYVEAVGTGLSQSLAAIQQAGFSFAFPLSGHLDVYLTNLGGAIGGYTVPLPAPERGAAFIVIDTQVRGDEALLRAVAAHQAAHAVLAGYDPSEPAWWHEASAAFLEVLSQRSISRYVPAMDRFLAHPELGLVGNDVSALTRGQGALLWVSYLVESSEGRVDLLARLWEDEAVLDGDNLVDSLERVVGMQGRTLPGAFADFTTWNLFTGPRDDGAHYSFGGLLSEPQFSTTHEAYPAAASPAGFALAPLGWTVIRFVSDGSPGGVALNFEGDEAADWQADVLIASRYSVETFRRAPLVIDGSRRAMLGIPWNDSGELLLLVRNLRTSGAPASFSYSASSAPAFPYELASLAAEPESGQIRLVWETESEDGLYGWDVYRSEGRGHFNRVSDVTVPALGGADGPVSYQFLDAGVRVGVLYQYYVVGITSEGLSQRSFIVTTRLSH